jgi:hypothetical protein
VINGSWEKYLAKGELTKTVEAAGELNVDCLKYFSSHV